MEYLCPGRILPNYNFICHNMGKKGWRGDKVVVGLEMTRIPITGFVGMHMTTRKTLVENNPVDKLASVMRWPKGIRFLKFVWLLLGTVVEVVVFFVVV